MRIRLNRMHFPVTALGPGRRVGLWLQGCSIGCAGCVARDTWAADDRYAVETDAILDFCRTRGETSVDGVTISGGEPFEQPLALATLLDALNAWRADREIDFLCYSGMRLDRLKREHADILARLDALIPEPYVRKRPSDEGWRGSDNQPLVPLSDLGERRYAHYREAPPPRSLQATVENGRVWMIGIPGPGDMKRLEEACRPRGVLLENVSWRS